MSDDTATARVAYLRLLKDEFNRVWPHGAIRSSEPDEREAFRVAKWKIEDLTQRIEKELR
jgi:hypothetical protein